MTTVMKALALGVALAAGSASAAVVNVGGVTWDTEALILDFTTTDTMYERGAFAVGDTLNGYALINNLNGTSPATFCPSCELTYIFSGYTVTAVDGTTGSLTFSGGTISVFVDDSPNWSPLQQPTASDGTLFLSLSGAVHYDALSGLIGTLHSDAVPTTTSAKGAGRGFLDVTGGLAAAYFDTDTFAIDTDGDGVDDDFADFQFTSSFQLLPNAGTFVSNGVTYNLFGSNDLQGDSRAVPEPSSIALLGLGLAGLGLTFRRRKVV